MRKVNEMSILKEVCNKDKNRNIRFVKVKQARVCKHCKGTIPEKDECLTINRQFHNREWLCKDCVSLLIDIANAKSGLELVAFGDEGGALAYIDYIAELESEYYGRGE